MREWLVKRGNTSVQDIPVKDSKGVLVTNLAAALEIKFQVKEKKSDTTPKISKTKGDGIQVDTPNIGYLRITIPPLETDITVKKYFMALEIVWSATEKWETVIEIKGVETDVFRIREHMIV
jgi:hypothetical protein